MPLIPFAAAEPPTERDHAWFSPWLIIGSVCILALILLVLALKNVRREQAFVTRALLSEADILMNSLEASSRSGMMGMHMMGQGMSCGRSGGGWGRQQLQLLMEQTAEQPEVFYVRLVAEGGRIMADSDPHSVDARIAFTPPPPGKTVYRFIDNGAEVFQVTRRYRPWTKPVSKRPDYCSLPAGIGDQKLYLVVGLDPTPFEAARRQDFAQTLFLFGVMFLVGAAGFVSLFWAGHYRAARKSLRSIESFTATIIDQMPVALIQTDRSGGILRTNASAAEILDGLLTEAHSIEEIPCFVPLLKELQERRAPMERELRCAANAAGDIPLWANASPLKDATGRVSGYLFLFTDRSDVEQLERQLRRHERMAALGRLAAGIAHEIRNPLSSIKGFAAILDRKVGSDQDARRITRVMQQEVERLNRAITELLEFARPMELNRRPVEVRELLEHAVRLVEDDARQHGVEVTLRVEPPELQACVDPDRFAQIILNLELNALQSMADGGRLQLHAAADGDEMILTVEDTGSGIDPADLPHIFDPYFTTKAQGVGLGLAIVNKLVEAHGGEIDVSSCPGAGTRFVIHLPAMVADQPCTGSRPGATGSGRETQQAGGRS